MKLLYSLNFCNLYGLQQCISARQHLQTCSTLYCERYYFIIIISDTKLLCAFSALGHLKLSVPSSKYNPIWFYVNVSIIASKSIVSRFEIPLCILHSQSGQVKPNWILCACDEVDVRSGRLWIILFATGPSTENTGIHLLGFQVSYSTIVAIVNLQQF